MKLRKVILFPTFKANLEGSEYDYSGIDHAEIKVSYEI